MSRAQVDLKAFEQTRQVIAGPGGDEMHGRVHFAVTVDGKRTDDCYCDVKLVVGGTYEVDAIEVGRPVGFRHAFNQAAFSDFVEKYVRGAVGSNGWAIRLGAGSSNIVMINCLFSRHVAGEFEVTRDGGTW